MTDVFPELLVSLTIQCTVLLTVMYFLAHWSRSSTIADRLWSCCHRMILLLVLAGVFLPHARLFRGESLLNLCHKVTTFPAFQSFWMLVSWIWAFMAFAMACNMLRSLIQTSFNLRHAKRLRFYATSKSTNEQVRRRCDTLNQNSTLADELDALDVQVVRVDFCTTPFCWQLHYPVIVLPESVAEFPEDELRAVVRHEFAHLKSRHPLRLLLQRIVEILFWFHPLVWMASRTASLQRELSADRSANDDLPDVTAFLRSLMRFSETSANRSHLQSLGLNLYSGSASTVRRRVDQLLAVDWTVPQASETETLCWETLRGAGLLAMSGVLATLIWIPLNSHASRRALLSPWPAPTATLLHEAGITVRDYELDSHRISEQFRDDD
jgi:bla regulator protein BlaR1